MSASVWSLGLALSYVNRRDRAVHLNLHLPHHTGSVDGETTVVLRRGARSVTGRGRIQPASTGALLVADVPAAALTAGGWRVFVQPDSDDDVHGTDGRVLVCDPNPISLLVGKRSVPPTSPAKHLRPRFRRAARAGTALAELMPPGAPARARGLLRRAAKQVPYRRGTGTSQGSSGRRSTTST